MRKLIEGRATEPHYRTPIRDSGVRPNLLGGGGSLRAIGPLISVPFCGGSAGDHP